MHISLATQSHIDGLAHIVKATFHLACPDNSDRDLQSIYIAKHLSANTFSQLICSTKHQVWVAIEGNTPVGLAVLELTSNDSAMLSKLYVLPTFHGQGIALALYKTTLNYVKTNGFKKLNLSVYSGNLKAKSFYEKQGFVLLKTCDFVMETEIHKDHIYELPII